MHVCMYIYIHVNTHKHRHIHTYLRWSWHGSWVWYIHALNTGQQQIARSIQYLLAYKHSSSNRWPTKNLVDHTQSQGRTSCVHSDVQHGCIHCIIICLLRMCSDKQPTLRRKLCIGMCIHGNIHTCMVRIANIDITCAFTPQRAEHVWWFFFRDLRTHGHIHALHVDMKCARAWHRAHAVRWSVGDCFGAREVCAQWPLGGK
jgi:hypothetical protein